jgi:hypothetical protein
MNNATHRTYHNFMSAEHILCEACAHLLDAYLAAECSIAEIRQVHPEIWCHLQICKRCANHYELAHKLLRESHRQPPHHMPDAKPIELPFLRFHQEQAKEQAKDTAQQPWQVFLRSRLFNEPFLLRFSLSSRYLQKFFRHVTAFATRPANATRNQQMLPAHILLIDRIPLYQQEIIAKIIVFPIREQSDCWRLQAVLTSTKPLPAQLQATLHWGALVRTCFVTASGEADLGGIDVKALSHQSVHAITFAAAG